MDWAVMFCWGLHFLCWFEFVISGESETTGDPFIRYGMDPGHPELSVNTVADMASGQQQSLFRMILYSSAPAVLDSSVGFQARLIPLSTNHSVFSPLPNRFIYKWMNMANNETVSSVSGLSSAMFFTFASNKVTAGEYVMTTAAYPEDKSTVIAAYGCTKFTLTQQLNGMMTVEQKLKYQRDPNIFSTRKTLTLIVNIHDKFLQTGLDYDFFWYQGSKKLANTKWPSFKTGFDEPSHFMLISVIFLHGLTTAHNIFNVSSQSRKVVSGTYAPVADSSTRDGFKLSEGRKGTRGTGQEYSVNDFSFEKSGNFQQIVYMKDPVQFCIAVRMDTQPDDRGISLKGEAVLNITCAGSTPSSVCLLMENLNGSLPTCHSCKPGLFIDTLSHEVHIQLHSTGWTDIHFFIYNDVSCYHLVESFFGYHPGSLDIPALVIPVVFTVLGIVTIIIGCLCIMYLRKKPMVEVADFDFRASLTPRQSGMCVQLIKLVNYFRSAFYRDTGESIHLLHKSG